MNFIDYINDQQSQLRSVNYVDMLWSNIKGTSPTCAVSLEDEEFYHNHIPVEFTKFLKNCVSKLRDLKISEEEVDWEKLDQKYLSTLIYFALQQEDVTMDNALYASNMFFLINTICVSSKQFFYKVLYLKIMEILKEFNRSQDMTNNVIMYLMDDFKTYLSKLPVPEDVIIPTVSVLHDYTYCCNDAFENIVIDVSYENLGYIAFVSLKVLTEQLSKQKNNDKKLFPILLSLSSSLKSVTTNNLSRTVKAAHQKNVRLFIKQNFNKFCSKSFCLVTDMLKFVYLNYEYDEFEAIAQIIQQLPSETHKNFITFFQNSLVCDDLEFRKNSLKMVLPILHHPAEHETNAKRLIRAEIFINSVIKQCADKDQELRENALKIVTEYSENTVGQQILQNIMAKDNYDLNRDFIMSVLHKTTDRNWRKKSVNVNYINLTCNLLIMQEDLLTIRTLNRFRGICVAGSPNDLKPCISHLKHLLRFHGYKSNVVVYVLSIFVKQIFHPMHTSGLFAKELYEFIFSNITIKEDDNFVWNIINYLISSNFDVLAVFERFNDLGLLRSQPVRILMEYKIQDDRSRTPALKLLCVMLHFVKYNECHCLDEKLEHSLTTDRMTMSDTDLYLVIYALIRILEKKRPTECSPAEINNYRQMQFLISQAFFDQVIPITCVKYIIVLLATYGRLIQEDHNWDTTGCTHFEEDLTQKLKCVCENKLEHSSYLSRDVVYIAELVILRKVSLSQDNFNQLKKIVTVAEHTPAFLEYLKNHQDIWALCVLLYVKVCFVDTELITECVANIEMTMSIANDHLKLQIIYALLDMCNMHLQYYDPLVPHLFAALYSKNAYMRFIASKILMQFISDEHLRLMDGQYFLFMGLLADEKEIIARNVEVFIKEKYVKKYYQTIARYFVPSMIHYNLYYEHPTISLSQPDQDLLKKRIYSWTDRSFIYHCLYQFLPDNLKFNILNQISVEIIVRILKKTVPHSAEIYRILEDALAVILYTVPKNKIDKIEDDRKFYETEMKRIETDLLVADFKNSETNVPAEHRVTLKSLLTSLFQLLYSEINQNPNICQNLLFTIIVLTKNFYSTIKHAINEDSSLLRDLYKGLRQFYVKMKHHFEYCLLTVNPSNSAVLSEREDMEFYLQEFTHFSLISPHIILGIEG